MCFDGACSGIIWARCSEPLRHFLLAVSGDVKKILFWIMLVIGDGDRTYSRSEIRLFFSR
jgi:hypothetical protein